MYLFLCLFIPEYRTPPVVYLRVALVTNFDEPLLYKIVPSGILLIPFSPSGAETTSVADYWNTSTILFYLLGPPS